MIQDLSQYTFPKKDPLKYWYHDRPKYATGARGGIIPILTKFGAPASEITSDICGYSASGGGITYSKKNPDDLVVIVSTHEGGKYIYAVLKGGRHLSLDNYGKGSYSSNSDMYGVSTADKNVDPKWVRNNTDKYNQYRIDKQTEPDKKQQRYDKSGASSIHPYPDATLNKFSYFWISTNTNPSPVYYPEYNEDYSDSIWTTAARRKSNQHRMNKR